MILLEEMQRKLTSAGRRLAERKLIARIEVQAKRKSYFRFNFTAGVTSSGIAAFCSAFKIGGFVPALFGLGSLACVLLYSEFLTIPRTFRQDMSPGGHLNPWRETLQRMGAEGRFIQGIIMLVIDPVALLIFSLVAVGLGVR